MTPLPTLRSARLTLRPLAEEDLGPLAAFVADPSVAPWWGDISDPAYVADGLRSDGTAFAIEVGGALAGWLGISEEQEPEYRHAGLDLMLAPGYQDRGLGSEALRTAIRWLAEARGHHRFTIDPSVRNERAIRAYEAVGFRPVGVMRRYERRADGSWSDSLLMDLLADELTSSPRRHDA
jgi:aminoglycoside 6'-N-acetyltransferase